MVKTDADRIRFGVKLKILLIYSLFVLVTVGVLGSYPTISSRNLVFSTKQSSVLGQISVMSSSLSALERLTGEGVKDVMALVDSETFSRVLVTDPDGSFLYDAGEHEDSDNQLQSLLDSALEGKAVFHCSYTGELFLSSAAVPVVCFGDVIGAVLVFESDSEHAQLIHEIQARIRIISLTVGGVTLLLLFLFTSAFTKRITDLVKAMRIVREGNYASRVVVSGSDELSELSSEFNDMTQRLQDTDELRRRFVSDASHELRTPLASIRLLSDSVLQSENMDSETMRDFVGDIGSEAERLQRMTEKLMKLTRMDSKVEVVRSPILPGRILGRIIHLLSPLADEKNVTIYSDIRSEARVFASEDDLIQIFFNLIENAIKYNTFGGNVFVRVSDDRSLVEIVVEDTGIGIPDADIPHIFSRFYRVDKARSRAAGGSGLGLSIVHDAVLSNGGRISVEHRETVGTRFRVTFPVFTEAGGTDESFE